MKTQTAGWPPQSLVFPKRRAFTLLELLVTIAIIGILAALLLPALSRSKQKAQGTFCVGNGRQLMTALRMYSDDFHEWLPPNPDYQTTKMWVVGDMGKPLDATNTALLLDPNRSAIAPYISGSPKVFKCPADKTAHVRTFSMSQAVGSKPGATAAAVDGPWLDGTHEHKANRPWRTYGRFSHMTQPGPSGLWVLIDEDPANISDGAFAATMALPTAILDWPGAYHNLAAGVHFADGHTETHRWRDPRTRPGGRVSKGLHPQPDNPDILWLQQRTSSRAE
ncbi:MAG TPA: type II secretion system protein [Clostridia bacterium]|nr:type II secretion system protein [Clostridia bacterium]